MLSVASAILPYALPVDAPASSWHERFLPEPRHPANGLLRRPDDLRVLGRSKDHIRHVDKRLRRLIRECHWQSLREATADSCLALHDSQVGADVGPQAAAEIVERVPRSYRPPQVPAS